MRPDAAERAMRVVDARLWWRGVVPETFAHAPPPCLPAQSALSIKDQRDGFVHFGKLFTSSPVSFKIWRAGQLAKRYTGCTGNIWDPQNA
jgi:hypothetical protein